MNIIPLKIRKKLQKIPFPDLQREKNQEMDERRTELIRALNDECRLSALTTGYYSMSEKVEALSELQLNKLIKKMRDFRGWHPNDLIHQRGEIIHQGEKYVMEITYAPRWNARNRPDKADPLTIERVFSVCHITEDWDYHETELLAACL